MRGEYVAYRKISKDEIELANQTNLVDFLRSQGHNVRQSGASFFWGSGGHNTLAIWGDKLNRFKHFASGAEGNAIVFCRNYLNMSFQQSVDALLGNRFVASALSSEHTAPSEPLTNSVPREPFEAPTRSADYSKLYDYLLNQRRLDKSVVDYFIQQGTLYPTYEVSVKSNTPYSNIAFIAKDFNGNAVGALKRSPDHHSFKGNHKNSNMRDYCFRHEGTSGRLFVFEAPIDMLSYISIMAKSSNTWKHDSFIAIGGTSSNSLINLVSNQQSADKPLTYIYLNHDNDKAGISARHDAIAKLRSIGFVGKLVIHLPKNKDWNDDLRQGIISTDLREVNGFPQVLESGNQRGHSR